MKLEIERKFLINALPEGLPPGHKIQQGYLSTSDPEVRIRQLDNQFFVACKSGDGICRQESEAQVSEEVFNILWPATIGKRVEKTRYCLHAPDGTIWELDKYQGTLCGLITVEIELLSETSEFQKPEILNNFLLTEVTFDPSYKNKNLALKGAPTIPTE